MKHTRSKSTITIAIVGSIIFVLVLTIGTIFTGFMASKDTEKAVESVSGIDIPDGMVDKVIEGVKAAIKGGKVTDAIDSIKKLFCLIKRNVFVIFPHGEIKQLGNIHIWEVKCLNSLFTMLYHNEKRVVC